MSKPKIYEQEKDDCWRISLCNLLDLPPKKVPHFVKKYQNDFVEETRKWLNKRGKSIVYVHFNAFLESGLKYNSSVFPQGKCIAILGAEDVNLHACLMIDGKLYENPTRDYQEIRGYFIVYDL